MVFIPQLCSNDFNHIKTKRTIINKHVLNQQWQRQNEECKPTKTNIFKHSKTIATLNLFLWHESFDERPFFTLTIKTKLRQKWRKTIWHPFYSKKMKSHDEIINRFGFNFFSKRKRHKKVRKSNWRMKNVLNCRENEAFVLILWRRRDALCRPWRDSEKKKKEK